MTSGLIKKKWSIEQRGLKRSKKVFIILQSGKMARKTTLRFYSTPDRMAEIRKQRTQMLVRVQVSRIIHCWWNYSAGIMEINAKNSHKSSNYQMV